jgi:Tol biopolymer transport system component/DNA-binding winged helix-turn-helix (wHTH) protein
MSAQSPASSIYRFGVFELNLAARQLRKNGRDLRLQEQPMRLLECLLAHPKEVVKRDELRVRLWPTETFVEFDDGLNTAVQKIRQALGDDARNPRFVETVPRQGYRFIAPIQIDIDSASPRERPDIEVFTVSHPAGAHSGRRVRWQGMWIALAAMAGVSMGWFLQHGASSPVRTPLKLSITPPAGVELRPGVLGGSAISPDGRTVAFVASRGGKTMLWLRSLDSLNSRELPGTEDALLPFWSPDSKSLGFIAAGKIRRVNVAGGPPQDVTDARRPTRAAWTEDGTILFAAGGGGPLHRVPATGGTAVPATLPDAGAISWPYPIAGTDKFLYDNSRGIAHLGSLSDIHKREPIHPADSNTLYAPPHDGQPGRLLWLRGTTLVGQVFDARRGKVQGEVVPIAEGVGISSRWRLADLSVSNNGVLLYGAGSTIPRRPAWLRRDGSLIENIAEPDFYRSVRLSPDGRRAVIERGIVSALWTMNFERNILTRLTFEQALSAWPIWSPDNRKIAYSGERGERLSLFLRDSSGAAPEERLTDSQFGDYAYDWSSDGRYIAFSEVNPQTKIDLWIQPMTGDRKPFPFLATPFSEDSPQFSPDVRWIAYVSDESGRNEIYVTSFPKAGGKWQISTAGGMLPRWRSDGRELFYVAPNGNLMSAQLKPGRPEFEWSTPRPLFALPMLGSSYVYDVDRRGDKFLVLAPAEEFKRNELTVLLNWGGRSQ